MLTFYTIPVSLYCAKLRIVLRHKSLDWQELPPPGGYGSDEYKTLVPSGNLPAMIDGKFMLADSEAIAEYLNEKHPFPAMLPQDLQARALCRSYSRFHDTRLEPALRAIFSQIPKSDRDPAVLAQAGSNLTQHLTGLAQMLRNSPRPEGGLWLSDCGFAITLVWLEALQPKLGLMLDWPADVKCYRKDIMSFPAVVRELKDYMPRLNTYLKNTS